MYVCTFGFNGASTSQLIGAHNEMMMDDYDGQMIFGDLLGLKLPDIHLTGEEKPRKTSPRKLVLAGDRIRARCVTSAHATTCSTAVDEHIRALLANPVRMRTNQLWQVKYGTDISSKWRPVKNNNAYNLNIPLIPSALYYNSNVFLKLIFHYHQFSTLIPCWTVSVSLVAFLEAPSTTCTSN